MGVSCSLKSDIRLIEEQVYVPLVNSHQEFPLPSSEFTFAAYVSHGIGCSDSFVTFKGAD